MFKGVKVGKGARIKSAVILPDTIVEENVWIENAVIGSQSLIKQGVIIIPRNPAEHLMVVGNRETVDIMIEEDNLPVNNLKTVISY